jgi:hypothetical protein
MLNRLVTQPWKSLVQNMRKLEGIHRLWLQLCTNGAGTLEEVLERVCDRLRTGEKQLCQWILTVKPVQLVHSCNR